MNVGHLWSWGPKMSKNIHDVWKLVLGGNSVLKPIWQTFRSQKSIKIGGRVVIGV